MEAARKKQIELLDDLYIDLLAKMNIFLEILNDFSKKISNQSLTQIILLIKTFFHCI